MCIKNLLLAGSLFLFSQGVSAQDAVHGVDGYYNFTPTQMKASGQWGPGNNGKKKSGYYPELRYSDDMKYAIFNLGVNKDAQDDYGQYPFRSELVLNETASGAGCMTVTSAYPVVAFKFSIPHNNENADDHWGFGYFEPEFSWYNPTSEDGTNPGQTSGNKYKLQLSGLDNNGRYRFVHYDPGKKDQYGRDSAYLNNSTALGYSKFRIVNSTDTIWHILRLAPNPDNPDSTDIILAMDLSKITTASGKVMLDSCDIKMKSISLGFLGVNATLDGKSQDQLPLIYFKWLKTFSSMQDFENSLTSENNYGDGPEVDPNKAVLNSELYNLKLMIYNYKFSDKVSELQSAYDAALAVYNASTSTSSDYVAQLDVITAAKKQFLIDITYDNSESKMSTFYSLSGLALGLTSNDVTVGSYTGRALTLVSAENAANFLLTTSGEINGQTCYTVQTGSYSMVLASDGQLLFVPASQLSSSSSRANLLLSNRKTVDDPGYDFKVGKYFYYYDDEEGAFAMTTEFPTVDDESELTNYLFYPQPAAEYDVNDHNDATHPMTSGEGSWCEFNDAIDEVINPAYEASFNQYTWDAAVKTVAEERAKQPQFEGWRTNGWRLSSKIEAATLENGEKVMKMSVMNEYDKIHDDTVNVMMATTDWTSTQQISVMREHGNYTSATNRAPSNNQTCDSLWAVNMNSGINRYFAMKWKASSDSITFNGLTFFVRKNIEEPGVGMATLKEQRGDVYIWDLLDCGIPYGDRKACAQYVSWNGISSPDDAVYVDWMRFYSNLDDIPTETMNVPTAIKGIENADNTLKCKTYYDLNGRKIGTKRPTIQGVYIVKEGNKVFKEIVK